MSDESAAPPPSEPEAPRGRRLTRRRVLGLAGAGVLGWGAKTLFWVPRPVPLEELELSDAARALVAKAWEGLDPARVVDVHVHVLGLGTGGTGCYVHPDSQSLLSPVRYLKTRIYKGAAGIYDDSRADVLFVERLVDLWRHQTPRPRGLLLPFEEHYTTEGEVDRARTEFHVPNDYVGALVRRHPDLFLAGCSVHPYRQDALEELERCRSEHGAVCCKWLPNAMGIDPLDPRCAPFYAKLAELKIALLSHTGEEQAVHAEEAQELGNPLRLRPALEAGVTVIAAHCGSLGQSRDLDAEPGKDGERPRVSSYALFRRLLAEERWAGRLYGDLSATTQFNRVGNAVEDLLTSPEVHARLANGSDYPLPAIDPLVRTGLLVDLGLLDPAERPAINELYAYNPVTYDFVLKRRLRVVEGGVERRFAAAAFETAGLFVTA